MVSKLISRVVFYFCGAVLNFVCALLRSLFLLFVSVSIIYAYAHRIRSPVQTYVHNTRTYMLTKHETIHSAIISLDILTWSTVMAQLWLPS